MRMRIPVVLAFLQTAAAVPLLAQPSPRVYHGSGYEVEFPAKCTMMPVEKENSEGFSSELTGCGNDDLGVIVIRFTFSELSDTTLATRRAMLQLMRAGMLGAAGEMTMLAEPRDFEREDRVGVRVPVSVTPAKSPDTPLYGAAEMSVARRGAFEMWVVMYLGRKEDAPEAAAGRVLESFHLTQDPPVEVRGFREAPANGEPGKTQPAL